jgi:hypothetical protein
LGAGDGYGTIEEEVVVALRKVLEEMVGLWGGGDGEVSGWVL